MEWIGEDLKERRKSQGIKLKDISRRTKISIKYLKAIEEGDFNVMPGEVYCLGFLKSYSKEIGFDTDELISCYKEYTEIDKEPADESEYLTDNKYDIKLFQNRLKFRYSTVFLIIILVLVITAFFLFDLARIQNSVTDILFYKPQYEESNGNSIDRSYDINITEEENEKGLIKQDETELLEPEDFEVQPPEISFLIKDENLVEAYSVNNADYNFLNIRIEISETSWLRILLNGDNVFEGLLQKGDSKEFEVQDEIFIRTGNAGGVKLFINEEEMGYMGSSGEIAENRYSIIDID